LKAAAEVADEVYDELPVVTRRVFPVLKERIAVTDAARSIDDKYKIERRILAY